MRFITGWICNSPMGSRSIWEANLEIGTTNHAAPTTAPYSPASQKKGKKPNECESISNSVADDMTFITMQEENTAEVGFVSRSVPCIHAVL